MAYNIKFIVAFLGTPILALVLKINNPTSDLEWITIFNASYHWLTLTTVLPGILGSVLMRRAKSNNIIRRYYLAILALPAIFISLVIYLISNVIPVLYPTLEPDKFYSYRSCFFFGRCFLILYQGLHNWWCYKRMRTGQFLLLCYSLLLWYQHFSLAQQLLQMSVWYLVAHIVFHL